jgi:hypothetical protein
METHTITETAKCYYCEAKGRKNCPHGNKPAMETQTYTHIMMMDTKSELTEKWIYVIDCAVAGQPVVVTRESRNADAYCSCGQAI